MGNSYGGGGGGKSASYSTPATSHVARVGASQASIDVSRLISDLPAIFERVLNDALGGKTQPAIKAAITDLALSKINDKLNDRLTDTVEVAVQEAIQELSQGLNGAAGRIGGSGKGPTTPGR